MSSNLSKFICGCAFCHFFELVEQTGEKYQVLYGKIILRVLSKDIRIFNHSKDKLWFHISRATHRFGK